MTEERVSPRPKVLFVVPSLSGGGAERCALEVAKGLDSSAFAVRLLPFALEGEYSSELPRDLISRAGVEVASGRTARRLPRFLRKWALPARQLAAAVRQERPDVVVSFLPEASLPTSLLRWLRRPDFVWVVSEQNATRRRVIEGNPSRWRRWLQDRWIRRAYRSADQVVAVSEGVREGLIRDYGLDGGKVSVIHNPVDRRRVCEAAARTLPPEWQGARFLVAMGRLTRQKGLDVLLRAFALVRERESVGLAILGVGEERKRLEALTAELRIQQDVHFLGFQANPWPYVKQAAAFVLSSRWEGCPLVIAEAMACGTPVVAADCDYGPRELIASGVDGLLVPPEDPRALAEAILALLAEPEDAASVGRRGELRARELDISVIAREYGLLLQRLLSSG